MKILFILGLISLIACDAPQRTRLLPGYDSMTSRYGDGSSSTTPGNANNKGDFSSGGAGSTTPSTSTEYSGCDYSYRFHTVDIGHFAICQSRTDETKFKFKTQMANRNVQVCLIPTYRDSTGSSTYLGTPQCLYTEAGKDYEGRLYKDRTNLATNPINGVIVLKYGLHIEYFNCMNAAVNWPANVCPYGATGQPCLQYYASCPSGAATNASCSAAANTHMRQVCEQFKARYSNSYADISTR